MSIIIIIIIIIANNKKEMPIIIHNATYDTHFILNQLAIEF